MIVPVPPSVPLIVMDCPIFNAGDIAVQENCPAIPVIATPLRVVVAPDATADVRKVSVVVDGTDAT